MKEVLDDIIDNTLDDDELKRYGISYIKMAKPIYEKSISRRIILNGIDIFDNVMAYLYGNELRFTLNERKRFDDLSDFDKREFIIDYLKTNIAYKIMHAEVEIIPFIKCELNKIEKHLDVFKDFLSALDTKEAYDYFSLEMIDKYIDGKSYVDDLFTIVKNYKKRNDLNDESLERVLAIYDFINQKVDGLSKGDKERYFCDEKYAEKLRLLWLLGLRQKEKDDIRLFISDDMPNDVLKLKLNYMSRYLNRKYVTDEELRTNNRLNLDVLMSKVDKRLEEFE